MCCSNFIICSHLKSEQPCCRVSCVKHGGEHEKNLTHALPSNNVLKPTPDAEIPQKDKEKYQEEFEHFQQELDKKKEEFQREHPDVQGQPGKLFEQFFSCPGKCLFSRMIRTRDTPADLAKLPLMLLTLFKNLYCKVFPVSKVILMVPGLRTK